MVILFFDVYQVGSVIALILGIWMTVRKRKTTTVDTPNLSPLTVKEKWAIFILCFFSPILLGAIFYFSWKKRLPQQAKTANWLSIIAFVLALVIFIGLSFYVSTDSLLLFPGTSPANLPGGPYTNNTGQ